MSAYNIMPGVRGQNLILQFNHQLSKKAIYFCEADGQ